MKSMILPVLLLAFVLEAGAQDQWTAQTSGTLNSLYSAYFPSGDTGYVSGASGTLLRTFNGGGSWTSQASGTAQPLNCVYFFDQSPETGYAVGGNGTILKTVDHGTTWAAQTSGTLQNLRFVIGKSTLAIAGGDSGVILKTVNGGTTWSRVPSGTSASLYAVTAYQAPGIELLAVGASGGVKSADTGSTWSALFSTPPSVALYDVHFDSITGFSVGASGMLLKTVNGGASWSGVTSGAAQTLNSVDAEDSNNIPTVVYAAGAGGVIVKSRDGGATWSTQVSGTSQVLNAVRFSHNGAAFAVYAVGNNGVILKNTVNAVFRASPKSS